MQRQVVKRTVTARAHMNFRAATAAPKSGATRRAKKKTPKARARVAFGVLIIALVKARRLRRARR
jgi:hypothetical protein